MENYIVINGRKAELTEEQLKALGIETEKKGVFSRVNEGHYYYRINAANRIEIEEELNSNLDNRFYAIANYCNDTDLLQQQAYRETLNRLLWRYSMEHDGDKIDWNKYDKSKWCIMYDSVDNTFKVDGYTRTRFFGSVYFYTKETAKNAIEEIIKPFMAEHPDFKW